MSPTASYEGTVITGAGSGLGRVLSELLLSRSEPVLACDVSAASLSELGELGATVCVADVASPTGRGKILSAAAGYRSLVNSAGIIRLVTPSRVTEKDWDDVFSVNARGLFFLCQGFSRVVPDGGRIINVASVAARTQATLETCVYAASKAAVLAITRTFAYELGSRNICVNAVLPGIADTPMQDKVINEIAVARNTTPAQVAADRLKAIPLGRAGTATECAALMAWLLSAEASYITGQAIAVDGGYTMI